MLAFELCGASIHPEEPLRAQPNLGADYTGPRPDQVPRSRHRDLQGAYLDYLDLDGGLELLSHELRQEDRVQAEFQRLLNEDDNGPRWASSYAEPLAFAGGGIQLVRQVETCTALVEEAVARTPAGAPRFYCGLRPNLGLGARSYAVDNGVVVLLDTGFLAAMRIFMQTVAASLDTIRRVPEEWIDGDVPVGGQYGSLSDLLDRSDTGQDVRDDPIQIALHTGAQDHLRRHAMLSAVCQLMAHEVAHWARSRPGPSGTWVPDNAKFQRAARVTSFEQLTRPIDEIDEVATGNAEHHADSIACAIQRQPPLWSGEPMLGQIIGAMAPLALHAGLWWRWAAQTDRNLGWTHPYPDLRMGLVGIHLASGEEAAQHKAVPPATFEPGSTADMARRFHVWARAVLDIDTNRSIALKRGLDNRGVAVPSRVFIDVERRIREREL
jgi:hypothetical protein